MNDYVLWTHIVLAAMRLCISHAHKTQSITGPKNIRQFVLKPLLSSKSDGQHIYNPANANNPSNVDSKWKWNGTLTNNNSNPRV